MNQSGEERVIHGTVTIAAPLSEVWEAWTTAKGISAFFAPACHIELKAGGRYEIYFNPDAAPGERGAEGTRILAYQPEKLLSFTWNSPPHLPDVRWQYTHVTLRFEALGENLTKVILTNDGYGRGGQWEESLAYFRRAWLEVVLPGLKQYLETSPIDRPAMR